MGEGFGAFGKMPALGDFIRFDLPSGFVDAWDAWLQDQVMSLKETLGERWQDCYFSAPIWRFTLAPGVMGDQAILGVLMASVDRVGRQFPLTLAAPIEAEEPVAVHLAQGARFAALEEIALAALEDDMTRERLAETLGGVPPVAPVAAARRIEQNGTLAVVAGTEGVVPSLAAEALGLDGATTVWSAILGDGERLLTCHGLPDPAVFEALFDLDAPFWTAEAA